MSPGLREHKTSSLRVCVAECLPEDMRAMTREIVGLESRNPRKGYATTLLWSVCHEADVAGITLILQPKPFGEGGPDHDKLVRFYGRFGFVEFQQAPVVLMARTPVRKRMVTLQ
jgi:hypothetical protein